MGSVNVTRNLHCEVPREGATVRLDPGGRTPRAGRLCGRLPRARLRAVESDDGRARGAAGIQLHAANHGDRRAGPDPRTWSARYRAAMTDDAGADASRAIRTFWLGPDVVV